MSRHVARRDRAGRARARAPIAARQHFVTGLDRSARQLARHPSRDRRGGSRRRGAARGVRATRLATSSRSIAGHDVLGIVSQLDVSIASCWRRVHDVPRRQRDHKTDRRRVDGRRERLETRFDACVRAPAARPERASRRCERRHAAAGGACRRPARRSLSSLLERLSAGGMGVVGRVIAARSQIALKFVRADLSRPDMLERLRAGKALARVSHQCRRGLRLGRGRSDLHRAGYVRGGTSRTGCRTTARRCAISSPCSCKRRVASPQRTPPASSPRLTSSVSSGVRACASSTLTSRVADRATRAGGRRRRASEPRLTRPAPPWGTPLYMSPRAPRQAPDARSDRSSASASRSPGALRQCRFVARARRLLDQVVSGNVRPRRRDRRSADGCAV